MTVTPLGRDQDCSLKNESRMCRLSWFLDPGGWSKTAAVGLYFIFPGICTLSLTPVPEECNPQGTQTNEIWQMDVFRCAEFGKLKYVNYTTDTYSGFL
ncbi:hypothetical protein STEG23_025215 [Scotinomys teguina]